MSWCNKLASTAAVGFKLDTHFASSDSLLDALAPVTDSLVDDEKVKFTIDQQGSFAVVFITEDGFKYAVDHQRVSVTFNHRLKAKPVSGSAPTMEMLSRPLPYTELLDTVSEKLIEATVLLNNIKKRTLIRVGIISTTQVDEKDIPPGIERLIKYVSRPWEGKLDHYSFAITANLDEKPASLDRCIHQIIRPEDREKLTKLQFDWQRIYHPQPMATRDALVGALGNAKESALKYFEELAEGSRFDEEILGATTPA